MKKNEIKKLFPPATIGIVGGGQLGRMFVFEAKRMGYNVIVLDPKANSPAGQVADEQIVAEYDELWAYIELSKKSDVITYEFEHINSEILFQIENMGNKVIPSAKTLHIIQNKLIQKNFLEDLDIKVPKFSRIENKEDLINKFGLFQKKAIIKSSENGYDGKGNAIARSDYELENAFRNFENQEIFIEELVDFIKEVSILIVKNDSGVYFYPVSENHHQDSILIKSKIPAELPEGVIKKINIISEKIVNALEDVGVFCIEFFIDKNMDVLVNEIAPRPHNSGHYTIEACVTSQFEQMVRVVCGMPAGSTKLRKPCVMYNILGNEDSEGEYEVKGLDKILEIEDCHFHLYGKHEIGKLRKLGHITAIGETVVAANIKAKSAMDLLEIKEER